MSPCTTERSQRIIPQKQLPKQSYFSFSGDYNFDTQSDRSNHTLSMAWSEAEVVCRYHPNENPQPGICPSCLRERLSRIAGNYYPRTINNNNTSSSSSSLSASPVYYYVYSSASPSGQSSPANQRHRHQRVASDVLDSIYNLAISGSKGLKKSRSMAFASRNCGTRDGVNGKKKGGFWNKLRLLRSSAKKAKI